MGGRYRFKCRAATFTLAAEGHVIDPKQALKYRAIQNLRRTFQRRPDLYDQWWPSALLQSSIRFAALCSEPLRQEGRLRELQEEWPTSLLGTTSFSTTFFVRI